MRAFLGSLLLPFLLLSVSIGAAQALDPWVHLESGGGTLRDSGGDRPDSILTWGDGEYESGIIWQFEGVQPPDWGAFAECYSGEWWLVAVVLDFTQNYYPQGDQTFDAYVWDDGGGVPGVVSHLVTGIDPGPVAPYPEYSRHYGLLPEPALVQGTWWVGFWPDWPGEEPGWFLACDHTGSTGGCMMTKIAAGLGYSTGWHSIETVWGPHTSIGISAQVRMIEPNPVRETSWGAVKALFRP